MSKKIVIETANALIKQWGRDPMTVEQAENPPTGCIGSLYEDAMTYAFEAVAAAKEGCSEAVGIERLAKLDGFEPDDSIPVELVELYLLMYQSAVLQIGIGGEG